ncbi:tyrosine-type recombinase/integrase [Candidatus Poriferisocius sp.]|uniref:tyrosine-type recombinase/integrase n=1 Tax=Candidatus Poriferisocius sp. TaxID=3101276 RepID=UPI003B012BF1
MSLLTAVEVKNAGVGKHHEGRGLFLRVYKSGSRCWVLRLTVDGRRREIGLGGWPAVSLADARRKAHEHHAAAADGRDPLADRRRCDVPTFREAARVVWEANRARWCNERTAVLWWASLENHAFPAIGDMAVNRITQSDVLGCVEPIWTNRTEAARKVRQRIRTVLRWCQAHGYVTVNSAGEAIDGALPPMPRVKAHFRSLPYGEVADALGVADRTGASASAKLCLRFTVLTAARSGEARNASWSEIDFAAREWRIPADKMKAATEHRVPLSDAALKVLDEAKDNHDGSDLVFPSPPQARPPPQRHDAHENPSRRRPGGAGHRPRIQSQLPHLGAGADRHPLGCVRGRTRTQPRRLNPTGLHPRRCLRQTPQAHGPVGRLPAAAIEGPRLADRPSGGGRSSVEPRGRGSGNCGRGPSGPSQGGFRGCRLAAAALAVLSRRSRVCRRRRRGPCPGPVASTCSTPRSE